MMARRRSYAPNPPTPCGRSSLPWSTGEPVLPLDEKEDAKYQQPCGRSRQLRLGGADGGGGLNCSPRHWAHSSGVSHFLGPWAVNTGFALGFLDPLLGIVSLILASLALFAVLYLLAK